MRPPILGKDSHGKAGPCEALPLVPVGLGWLGEGAGAEDHPGVTGPRGQNAGVNAAASSHDEAVLRQKVQVLLDAVCVWSAS